MALTSVDYLEHGKKRTYKPEPSGLILTQPPRRSRPAITGACWYHGAAPGFNPVGWGTNQDDFARQLQVLQDPQGRNQDLRLLQPARGRAEWLEGNFAPAVLAVGAAAESPSARAR